jgi:hypothetical protein
MQYLPSKVFDEMAALHDQDPGRWTAVTLAVRYDAPQESVAAALLLAKRGSRNTLKDQRAKVAQAWATLPESGQAARRRPDSVSAAVYSDGVQEKVAYRKDIKPRFDIIDDIYSAAVDKQLSDMASEKVLAAGGETLVKCSNGASRADRESQDQTEMESDVSDDTRKKSLAELMVEGLIADDKNVDARRKTSFAFIEAGVPNEQRRAVWIRDGSTGRIRLPTADERSHILGGPQRRFQKPRRKV